MQRLTAWLKTPESVLAIPPSIHKYFHGVHFYTIRLRIIPESFTSSTLPIARVKITDDVIVFPRIALKIFNSFNTPASWLLK